MWNPFVKKYYRRTCPSSRSNWSHELIEIQGWLFPKIYRGVTFSRWEDSARTVSFDHKGERGPVRYLWNVPYHGVIESVSKEHFEMMWNMYHVTGEEV